MHARLCARRDDQSSGSRLFRSGSRRVSTARGGGRYASGVSIAGPADGHRAYMCAYTITKNGISTGHLMQGRWTPNKASKITVTLAGRTGRCGTLKEAIQTLH